MKDFDLEKELLNRHLQANKKKTEDDDALEIVQPRITIKSNFIDEMDVDTIQKVNEQIIKENKKDLRIVRKSLTEAVKKARDGEGQDGFRLGVANFRQVPVEILDKLDCIFIEDYPDNKKLFGEYLHMYELGLMNTIEQPRYSERFLIPIKGFTQEVVGIVGYDSDSKIKYLLSTTQGFGTGSAFFGMHLMPWIYNKGFVVVVEGIFDAIYLWSVGIPAVSLLGGQMNDMIANILRRFGEKVIFIPDSDEAGRMALAKWKSKVNKGSILRLNGAKDIDEWRKVNDQRKLMKAIKHILTEATPKYSLDITI